MQLTKTIFSDSVNFIEKNRVANRVWEKSEFLRQKNKFILPLAVQGVIHPIVAFARVTIQ